MPRPIKPGWITAKTADINDLYERSVQCPESEVELIYQAWSELRDRKPTVIREDFYKWIQNQRKNTEDLQIEVIGITIEGN